MLRGSILFEGGPSSTGARRRRKGQVSRRRVSRDGFSSEVIYEREKEEMEVIVTATKTGREISRKQFLFIEEMVFFLEMTFLDRANLTRETERDGERRRKTRRRRREKAFMSSNTSRMLRIPMLVRQL